MKHIRRLKICTVTAVVCLGLAIACKPKKDSGNLTAVTNESGDKAFALIPLQNLTPVVTTMDAVPKSDDPSVQAVVKEIGETVFGPIECKTDGLSAKEHIRGLELLSASHNLFIDSKRQLVSQNADKTFAPLKCGFFAPRLVSKDVFIDAFVRVAVASTDAGKNPALEKEVEDAYLLAQTFFLAARGPYDLEHPELHSGLTVGRALEMFGTGASADGNSIVNDFHKGLAEADPIYNPCVPAEKDSPLWFVKKWKRVNFSCDRSGTGANANLADYHAGKAGESYQTRLDMVINQINETYKRIIPTTQLFSSREKLSHLLTTVIPDHWSNPQKELNVDSLIGFLSGTNPSYDLIGTFKAPAIEKPMNLMGESVGFSLDYNSDMAASAAAQQTLVDQNKTRGAFTGTPMSAIMGILGPLAPMGTAIMSGDRGKMDQLAQNPWGMLNGRQETPQATQNYNTIMAALNPIANEIAQASVCANITMTQYQTFVGRLAPIKQTIDQNPQQISEFTTQHAQTLESVRQGIRDAMAALQAKVLPQTTAVSSVSMAGQCATNPLAGLAVGQLGVTGLSPGTNPTACGAADTTMINGGFNQRFQAGAQILLCNVSRQCCISQTTGVAQAGTMTDMTGRVGSYPLACTAQDYANYNAYRATGQLLERIVNGVQGICTLTNACCTGTTTAAGVGVQTDMSGTTVPQMCTPTEAYTQQQNPNTTYAVQTISGRYGLCRRDLVNRCCVLDANQTAAIGQVGTTGFVGQQIDMNTGAVTIQACRDPDVSTYVAAPNIQFTQQYVSNQRGLCRTSVPNQCCILSQYQQQTAQLSGVVPSPQQIGAPGQLVIPQVGVVPTQYQPGQIYQGWQPNGLIPLR